MEKILNDYLEKMEKHLKPIPISERMDIINEIKSEMQELYNNGVPAEKIIERLGNPKDLAKAYLGDLLSKERHFSWNRILIICAFFSLFGLSGICIVPCLGVIAPSLMISGILCVMAGIIKMLDSIFALNLPYVENIGVHIGENVFLHPVAEFMICLIIGVLLFYAGYAAWKLLVLFCKKVSRTAKKL